MPKFNINEFKPTAIFLVKFIGLYFALNLIYGFYVEAASPKPDAATVWVTNQTALIIQVFGMEAVTKIHESKPTTSIYNKGNGIVSVYEGCNGINVIIIFLCFLLSFGPLNKKLVWFAPLGIVLIHLINLGRIIGLFFVVIYLPNAIYFSHKYFFTAIIYGGVFLLWIVWLRINYVKQPA